MYVHEICRQTFRAALLKTARTWKPKHPLTGERLYKLWHNHPMEYYQQ